MGPDLALRRLEEVRREVELLAVPVPHRGGALSVTVSIGLATWPADGGTIDHVLQRADERLYEAKGRGRNRVCGPAARPVARPELTGREAAGA
jgi:diguanylate cyclase (GGDEF)-like protein